MTIVGVVASSDLRTVSSTPIPLGQGSLAPSTLTEAANEVNERLLRSQQAVRDVLDLFDIIDLRMLSGLVGELFSSAVAGADNRLLKNPNIDGYPDLCDVSTGDTAYSTADFIAFPGGGLEVKNTFGLKRTGVDIGPRQTRSGLIQRKLVWKAHHRSTNRLVALRSDYISGVPQIVAGYFSSDLIPADWTEKQQPREGSTMTSFCQTRASAFEKLQAGLLFVHKGYEG